MTDKTWAMLEIKPDKPHTQADHDLHCLCSNCGTKITANADFGKDGRLLTVRFPINYCPNCQADIRSFVQYAENTVADISAEEASNGLIEALRKADAR